MGDYSKWHRGNLKLEGSNWFMIQLKRIYVLTFMSRHCNVYHRVWRYLATTLVIVGIIAGIFLLHFYMFPAGPLVK